MEGPVLLESIAAPEIRSVNQPTKTGRACAWNVFQVVAWGDVRLRTAMENGGGLSRVASVHSQVFQLLPNSFSLPNIARYCTVARRPHGHPPEVRLSCASGAALQPPGATARP